MKRISGLLSDFRERLTTQKQTRTYAQLAGIYEVNQFYLWNIINDEDYQPPYKVCKMLGITTMVPVPACPDCGKGHAAKSCPEKRKARAPREKSWPRNSSWCRVCRKWTGHVWTIEKGLVCRKCGEK